MQCYTGYITRQEGNPMTPTLKDDFIAFFERLTHKSPEIDKAIAKLKTRDIKNTEADKAACADTLLRFCAGQFGGVKPVKPALTENDWKRIKALEKNHYRTDGQQANHRRKPR